MRLFGTGSCNPLPMCETWGYDAVQNDYFRRAKVEFFVCITRSRDSSMSRKLKMPWNIWMDDHIFFRNGGCAPASASKRCIRLMTTWIDGGHTYYHCWAWTKLQVLLYHYFSAGIRSGLIRYLHVITYMIRWLHRQACYAGWYNRIVVSTSWKLYFFRPYLATHVFGDRVWPTKNGLYITKLYY
jgi:hypothetical protein